jgi:hypothetical protein
MVRELPLSHFKGVCMRSLKLLCLAFVLFTVSFAVAQENSMETISGPVFFTPISIVHFDPDLIQAQEEMCHLKKTLDSLKKKFDERELHQVNVTLDSLRNCQRSNERQMCRVDPNELSLKTLLSLGGVNEKTGY